MWVPSRAGAGQGLAKKRDGGRGVREHNLAFPFFTQTFEGNFSKLKFISVVVWQPRLSTHRTLYPSSPHPPISASRIYSDASPNKDRLPVIMQTRQGTASVENCRGVTTGPKEPAAPSWSYVYGMLAGDIFQISSSICRQWRRAYFATIGIFVRSTYYIGFVRALSISHCYLCSNR